MWKPNEDLIRDYLSGRHGEDLLDIFWAEKLAYHGRNLGELTTHEELRTILGGVGEAMPDMQIEIESILSNEDYVVAKLKVTGTQASDDGSGTVLKTGEKVTFSVIDVYRIKDGKIVEQWVVEGLIDHRNPERARVE